MIGRSLVLAVLLLVRPAGATTLDQVRSRGVLLVGTTGDYRPFSILATDGTYHGADIDLVRRFATRLGVRIDFVPTRWGTLLTDFTAGRFDLAVGGISIRADRAAVGDFSLPLQTDGKRPIARCADHARYATLAALDRPEVRVVVNPGGSNEIFAHARLSHARLQIVADNQAVPDALADGSADVFVTDGIETQAIARRFPGVLCPTDVAAPFTEERKAWLIPKDAGFKAEVDAMVTGALNDGTWQRSVDRALGP